MPLSRDEVVALIVAVSFAAGLNVYATVATLGLLARAGVLVLPGSLDIVANWWVIGASAFLFVIEFFADKIPGFDLLWNAVQTVVRVPASAVMAFAATNELGLGWQVGASAAGGLIAFAAHGGKIAARAAVTPSPEPVSNVVLSLGEDALAVFLTWFATQHPYIAAAIVLVLLAIIVLAIRWIVGVIRRRLRRPATAAATS
jgi:hypothetical protein